jgi:hypothetical protein
LEPYEALFIDDHAVNVLAAREVGIHSEVFTPVPSSDRVIVMRRLLAKYNLADSEIT